MPQVTQRKTRQPHTVIFDTIQTGMFAPVVLAASQPNTTVQGRFLFPTTAKILRVMVDVYGAPAGTLAVNLVAGIAAEAGVGTPDTVDNGQLAYPRPVAPAGTQLFATDQNVNMVADTPTQLDVPADLFDVIFKGLVTLRTTTNAAAVGTILVSFLYKLTDINPPVGSRGFPAITTLSGASYAGEGSFTPAVAIP